MSKQNCTTVWSCSVVSWNTSRSFDHTISGDDTITACSTEHSYPISCIHRDARCSSYVEIPECAMSGLISFFLINKSESCEVYIIRYITLEENHPYGIYSIISWQIRDTGTSHRSWDFSDSSREGLEVFLITCWVLHPSISIDVLKFYQDMLGGQLWDAIYLILVVSHTDEFVRHRSGFPLWSLVSCRSLRSLTPLFSLSTSRSCWSHRSLGSLRSASWSLRSLGSFWSLATC